ncbi:RNA-splicing ligase RtcB [Candidatus Magnetaquicoccaceae bacterium FCR-1]|uniref:3'-phosphate/5'-hydroxy nucleic acid ligase n=1 Tax=Candidatus Magnetaquiglobus chichijimensis TaxID=3141448 RepID=A0ABQ0C6Z9_9PROT
MPVRESMERGRVPVKIFTDEVDDLSRRQLANVANLPFVFHHVAAMPDVHAGMGATIGSVIPTVGALIPAAVGVDIGCGMCAVPLDLTSAALGDNGERLRAALEKAIPHGRTDNGGPNDRGAWSRVPEAIETWWTHGAIQRQLGDLLARHPKLLTSRTNTVRHLGTLGTGNHFVELRTDSQNRVWILIHSGSRGIGNRIGTYFIQRAKDTAGHELKTLPDPDLAFFKEGSADFADYVRAAEWAQGFAKANRAFMLGAVIASLGEALNRPIRMVETPIDCHHNYVVKERHFGTEVWITRKGAIRARRGDMGVLPGSMGTPSYIVRGKGNEVAFHSSAHGAGRRMGRNEAMRRFTVADLAQQTQGIACPKDRSVLDEIPGAYKAIDAVMRHQEDLAEAVHELLPAVCVKG